MSPSSVGRCAVRPCSAKCGRVICPPTSTHGGGSGLLHDQVKMPPIRAADPPVRQHLRLSRRQLRRRVPTNVRSTCPSGVLRHLVTRKHVRDASVQRRVAGRHYPIHRRRCDTLQHRRFFHTGSVAVTRSRSLTSGRQVCRIRATPGQPSLPVAGMGASAIQTAAQIHSALPVEGTVLNVWAGAGSYEPAQTVAAVEPSMVMIAQRSPGSAPPCVQATAEALPLRDKCVDAAMALLPFIIGTTSPPG